MDAGGRELILFDGVCVLCSRWYRFVTARDPDRRFRFVAVQSDEGRALAGRHGIDPDDPATFILVTDGRAYVRSDAVLRILGALPGWAWTGLLYGIPARWRDAGYDLIARNRYRWFGRREVCLLPERERDSG